MLDRALLPLRTARHLRARQWVYWPLRRVQRSLPARVAAPESAALHPMRADLMSRAVLAWGPGDVEARLARAHDVVAGRFRFLNHAEDLGRIDWHERYAGHLWSFNLHYFDYARDLAWAHRLTGESAFAARFAELAESWIEGTRDGEGDGWEPYALSMRVVNWAYALLLARDVLAERSLHALLASMHGQLAFLERRVERHLLANHLQKNLHALIVGGLLFDGPAAAQWRRRAAAALWREVPEQVLADGGHFERSPMYHAIALGDLLEVISLLEAVGEPVPPAVRERVAAMARALALLSRSDGTLHLFNDAANGVAPSSCRLARLASAVLGAADAPAPGAWELPTTGYFGTSGQDRGERLIVDCGQPGPAYQPAHAHCDLLSFELDLAGRPAVVDSGTSGYGGDPLREYVRSTRAHNTVVIGGSEQSEVWGTFRMARRAEVLSAEQRVRSGEYRFAGAYRPYHHRRVVHRRAITNGRGRWLITDRVDGAPAATLESFVHLHPDFVVAHEGTRLIARAPGVAVVIEPFGADEVRVRAGERSPVQGWYAPEFGLALPAPVVEMRVARNDGREFGYAIRRAESV